MSAIPDGDLGNVRGDFRRYPREVVHHPLNILREPSSMALEPSLTRTERSCRLDHGLQYLLAPDLYLADARECPGDEFSPIPDFRVDGCEDAARLRVCRHGVFDFRDDYLDRLGNVAGARRRRLGELAYFVGHDGESRPASPA